MMVSALGSLAILLISGASCLEENMRRLRRQEVHKLGEDLESFVSRVQQKTFLRIVGPPDEEFEDELENMIAMPFPMSMSMSMPQTRDQWRFNVLAGVSSSTSEYYGGFAQTRQLILDQFDVINSKFSNAFDADIVFTADDIYMFSGPVYGEVFKSHPNHDYLIIYDGFPEAGGGWFGQFQTIYHSWSVHEFGGTFGSSATDGLIHELGHARAAVDIYAFEVLADLNPVVPLAYEGPKSIMKYPYGETTWDEHSINVINSGADSAPASLDFILETWPPEIVFDVRDSSGNPLVNVDVNLYAVIWYNIDQDRLRLPALYSYLTDPSGKARIDVDANNPFIVPQQEEVFGITHPNFLVEFVLNKDTKVYDWLPFIDVQNAQVTSPGSAFTVQAQFP